MKRILTFAITILMVSLSSCKKDKNEENPLIGTWKLETATIDNRKTELNDCQKQTTYVFTDKTIKVTLVSRKDNSTECESLVTNHTYTISGNKITASELGEATFSVNGNTLTLSGTTSDTKNNVHTFKKQ